MSRYTTEVRYICEVSAGLNKSVGFNDIPEVIEKCLPVVFNFDFPIFDENYRKVLESKILLHFYTREIGFESVGLWKLKLMTKLHDIMPLYNQLYKSELLAFNPLYDVDLTRQRVVDSAEKRDVATTNNGEINSSVDENTMVDVTLDNNTNTTDNGKTDTTTKNISMHSETPQGAITDLEAGKYMSDATIDNNTNGVVSNGDTETTQNGSTVSSTDGLVKTNTSNVVTGSSNSDINTMENYIETVRGKQGSTDFSSLLIKFRETFLNIDMLIIDELDELFFGLWV